VPEISRFFGILIAMYHNDYQPPHFHVRYGGQKAIVNLQTLELLEGKLPSRVHRLVLKWATLYQQELLQNWELARNQQPLNKIPPLE
jgi:hypothetical protein